MNEYLKQYIELQKQFWETEENPDSVRTPIQAMKPKTLTIQFNDEQLPILPVELEAHLSFATHADGTELELTGNRARLRLLAKAALGMAETTREDGFHIHLDDLYGINAEAKSILIRKEAIPMSTWSGMRNKLENDYLCPALRGHIQYFATSYSKSADHEGRAAIRVDGVEVLRSNYYTYFENVWTKFHHLQSTTLKDHESAKEPINQAHAYALEQGTFDQRVFYEAFGIFDNQSIEKSLVSENPLVRIFALLDRRLGKRRLLALEESMEQELDWVRAFYVIRLQAEGLMEKE